MKFRIRHHTHYRYSRPVFLEPHVVRLCPQGNANQRVASFALQIEPRPSDRSEYMDAEGNTVTQIWFRDLTDVLRVTGETTVETLCANPFDYLVDAGAQRLPVDYSELDAMRLTSCRTRTAKVEAIEKLAATLADKAGGQTQQYLPILNDWIYTNHRTIIREDGDPWPAEVTLERAEGSCRDLVVLFMELCRAQGLAARFVSGYQEGDPDQEHRDLHAWAEVYLPGGGWRGFDPTHGLAVADRHVMLAASCRPEGAAPISGTFRGTGATAVMSAKIEIDVTAA